MADVLVGIYHQTNHAFWPNVDVNISAPRNFGDKLHKYQQLNPSRL